MFAMWLDTGRMLSWSSITTQFLQDARDRINLHTTQLIRMFSFECVSLTLLKSDKHPPLIEPSNHILMGLSSVSRVNILHEKLQRFYL